MNETITVVEQFQVEASPDVAFIKVHFVGEGMTMVDAVSSVRKKVADAKDHLRRQHSMVTDIDIYDVYIGQKDDGLRSESQSFPRPLVVQGLLISAPPDDESFLYSITDELIKHGALPNNPHQRNYLSDVLDTTLLFGLVEYGNAESAAIAGCINAAEQKARSTASAVGKTIGNLVSLSKVTVEPSCSEPFKKDYVHIRRSFPTRFLSPTSHKVLVCASLTAEYRLEKS